MNEAIDKPARLLLIEDNPGDVRLIREHLRDTGKISFLIEHADRLAPGLEILRRGGVALVLLDLSLPDSSGLDTLASVRCSAPKTPVVVLTGWNDTDTAVRAVREGAQDYLVKGEFDGGLLARSIRYAIERKCAEESLRESEQKYRVLIANAGEAIFIAQDESVKFPNPKTLEMTGYSIEELAVVPFTLLIHPEDRDAVLKRYFGLLLGRRPSEPYQFRIIRKSGEEIWVQLIAVMIDWEGKPGVLCFLRDNTKEKKMETQFRHAQKMEAVGRLAAGIAHDFNNLLTITIGCCDLALARVEPLNPLRRNLEEIRRSSDRCVVLTRQLLAFSRKQILAPKVINLGDVVAGMENMLRRIIGEDIDLVSVRGKDTWNVKADPGHMEQVIMNLAVNSCDAMPQGGKLTIETENVELDASYTHGQEYIVPGSYGLLAISDTGSGMDEGTLARIFDPFYTTKEKGTGLGLSTVYGIVKQSGGYIDVYSEPGIGTTFKLYFPHVEETATRISRPTALPLEEIRDNESTLVTEDEDQGRK